MAVKLRLLFVLPAFAAAATAARADDPKDPLAALDFLIGSWTGSSAVTQGTDTFSKALDGKVIQRSAHAKLLGKDGKAAGAMDTLMTIHPDPAGTGLRAVYFDNDGHVIHYKTDSVVAGARVVFVSDGSDPGPLFRLSYLRKSPDQLHTTFEMAAPGHPEAFRVIAEGDSVRAP